MNFLTHVLHLVRCHCFLLLQSDTDPLTRPNVLAGFQLELLSSIFEALSQRAAAEGDTLLAEKLANTHHETRHGHLMP